MIINIQKRIYPNEFIISDLALNNSFIITGLVVTKIDDTHIKVSPGKFFLPLKNTICELKEEQVIELNPSNTTEERLDTLVDGNYDLCIIWYISNNSFQLEFRYPNDFTDPNRTLVLATCQVSNEKIQDITFDSVNRGGILGSSTGASGCVINRSDPIPITHGGLTSGTIIENMTPCQVLEQILYPYMKPQFTSFYIQDQQTTLEIGDSVHGGNRIFRWATINNNNISPNSISIRDKDNNILAENLENTGSQSIEIDTITNNSQSSFYWTIFGKDTKGEIFSRQFTVTWLPRIYWGNSTKAILEESDVKMLDNSKLASSVNGNYSFMSEVSPVYYYIVFPSNMSFNKWIDVNSGFAVDYTIVGNIDITNDFGVTTTYTMIRTTYLQNGNLESRVS